MTIHQTILKKYYKYRIKRAVGDMFWRALEKFEAPDLDMKAMYKDIVAKNNWRVTGPKVEGQEEVILH